jgi:hypothetical protein
MTAYYSTDCGIGLSQKLTIPTTPEPLVFYLNPEDLLYQEEDAGASISIKYERFTREISAVVPTFQITLYGLTAETVYALTTFAESDFLNNVSISGKGSISLYYQGQLLNNLYIQPPIQKSKSWFKNWESPTPTEIFDSITLTLVSPNPRWF